MDSTGRHDRAYEFKTLFLLALGFGLVGLDRWMVAPLFPYMMRDLGLNFQQLGNLIGVLAIAWGVWAIAIGPISDRIGCKRILVGTMIAFSLLSGFSGMATGYLSLLLIRGIMGVAEGAFTPASVAATGEASLPSRRGFNLGLQMSTFSLFGMGIAPILATQLLRVLPSWHWVFLVSALPGLIVAALIAKVLHDRPQRQETNLHVHRPKTQWRAMFRSRNVIVAMLGMLCAMAGIFVIGAMVPSYLVAVLHLDTQSMGFVASALGWGGFIGSFALSGISDYIGRKAAAIGAFAGAAALLFLFARTGANPTMLFVLLFGISMCSIGLLSLLSGPIATEAAPAGLIASTIGLVSGIGEIFGGGVAPAIAGYIAQNFGLPHVFDFALVGLVLGVFVTAALVETAPRRRYAAAASGEDPQRVA
ncbi:MFS transporter [Paraburkholderia gardini]|uniref:Sialic acid transporter NanT n=1 Tax=Paraburkholderia gardini TaxID=2823469 RepID=A0ABM8U7V9_9BURK|nr:MFS transporter [Paraburkholderia gardini]CAG4913694.1 Sialic acid transporter NanT [Paraburkholderia gardini]